MKLMRRTLAEKFGLRCVDEQEGLFHLLVQSVHNEEDTLDKMTELEKSGFIYQGIENIVGHPAVMIFKYKQPVYFTV